MSRTNFFMHSHFFAVMARSGVIIKTALTLSVQNLAPNFYHMFFLHSQAFIFQMPIRYPTTPAPLGNCLSSLAAAQLRTAHPPSLQVSSLAFLGGQRTSLPCQQWKRSCTEERNIDEKVTVPAQSAKHHMHEHPSAWATSFASSRLPPTPKQMSLFMQWSERSESSKTDGPSGLFWSCSNTVCALFPALFGTCCARCAKCWRTWSIASPVAPAKSLASRYSQHPGAGTAGEFWSSYRYVHVNIKVKIEDHS